MANPNWGYIAKYEFNDKEGRPSKRIRYASAAPFTTNDSLNYRLFDPRLRVYSIIHNIYGWGGFYRVNIDQRSDQTIDRIFLQPEESLEYRSIIYYDLTGTQIIGISGPIPEFLEDAL